MLKRSQFQFRTVYFFSWIDQEQEHSIAIDGLFDSDHLKNNKGFVKVQDEEVKSKVARDSQCDSCNADEFLSASVTLSREHLCPS